MKILIAEDEKVMGQVLKDFLELMGHKTIVVENGELAWEYWQNNSTDLVISDINMPLLNGLELLERIKNDNSDFPVIIITGVNVDDVHREKTIKKADAFLAKPFKMNKLINYINDIV